MVHIFRFARKLMLQLLMLTVCLRSIWCITINIELVNTTHMLQMLRFTYIMFTYTDHIYGKELHVQFIVLTNIKYI